MHVSNTIISLGYGVWETRPSTVLRVSLGAKDGRLRFDSSYSNQGAPVLRASFLSKSFLGAIGASFCRRVGGRSMSRLRTLRCRYVIHIRIRILIPILTIQPVLCFFLSVSLCLVCLLTPSQIPSSLRMTALCYLKSQRRYITRIWCSGNTTILST